MKRFVLLIFTLIFLAILLFVFITTADSRVMTKEEALHLGEEKYLTFLWMVDGAFNSDKLKEDFMVNDKSISDKNKVFTCKYKNKKAKECTGINFESEFKKLFSKAITYEKVYGDELIYSWITVKNGEYIFSNIKNCNVSRMGIKHTLDVVNIFDNRIIYNVSFNNSRTNQINSRKFELIYEDNEWKISEVFYYDLCGMWYTIY